MNDQVDVILVLFAVKGRVKESRPSPRDLSRSVGPEVGELFNVGGSVLPFWDHCS